MCFSCSGHDQGHLGEGLTHQKGGEMKEVFQQLIALVIVLEIVGNVHVPSKYTQTWRRLCPGVIRDFKHCLMCWILPR